MSARYLARAVRPIGRPAVASARPPTTVSGMDRFFTVSAFRRGKATAGKVPAARTASTWSGPGVLAVAAVAGLLGWGLASFSLNEFPGATRLDSRIAMPKYASMRDMEVVGSACLAMSHPLNTVAWISVSLLTYN